MQSDSTRSRTALTVLLRASVFVALLEVRLLFAYLRGVANNAGFPHERAIIPAIDRFIGYGATPGQRLQSWFFAGHLTWFDRFWLGIYDSWFVVPTVITLYIVVCHWTFIRSYAAMRLLVYFLPLPIYLLMPSEPPWMAIHMLRIATLTPGGIPPDANPVAAFPSMHVLTPATIALWLWWKRLDVMALVCGVYAALTIFAVLYLGEHYLVDVLASLVLAPVIVMATARFGQLLRARARAKALMAPTCEDAKALGEVPQVAA